MTNLATVRVLPAAGAWPVDELLRELIVVSPCRVKGAGDQWWAAYRDKNGFLIYLAVSDLRPSEELLRPK